MIRMIVLVLSLGGTQSNNFGRVARARSATARKSSLPVYARRVECPPRKRKQHRSPLQPQSQLRNRRWRCSSRFQRGLLSPAGGTRNRSCLAFFSEPSKFPFLQYGTHLLGTGQLSALGGD